MVSERAGVTASCAIFLISVGVCIFWLVFRGMSTGLCVSGCAMALISAVFCFNHYASPQNMRFACNGAMLCVQAGSMLLWLWQAHPGHRLWHIAVLCLLFIILAGVGRVNALHVRKTEVLRHGQGVGLSGDIGLRQGTDDFSGSA